MKQAPIDRSATNTIEDIDDAELERLMQSAREHGDDLSRHLITWREANLADYPDDGIQTASLIASLVPVADTLFEHSQQTSVDDAVREANVVLRAMLHRRALANRD